MTREECKLACENEDTFRCMAFDYYKPSDECYMKTQDRFTDYIYESSSYDYFDRNCYRKNILCILI